MSLPGLAGAEVVAKIIQSRGRQNSAYLVERAEISEIRLLVQAEGADLVIFDEELSSQQRNIEEMLPVKVIDKPD